MAKQRKEMTTEQKEIAVRMINDGQSQRKIAKLFGVSQSGISKFVKRFKERESVENITRSGRPLKGGKRSDRQIVRVARTNRRTPLAELTCIVNQTLPHLQEL